jgi:hypothetical protein
MDEGIATFVEEWQKIILSLQQVPWDYKAAERQLTFNLLIVALIITGIAYFLASYINRPIALELGARSRVKKPQEIHTRLAVKGLAYLSFGSAIMALNLFALAISPWIILGIALVGLFAKMCRFSPNLPLPVLVLLILLGLSVIGYSFYADPLPATIFLLTPLLTLCYASPLLRWFSKQSFGLGLTYVDAATQIPLKPVPKAVLQIYLTDKEKKSQKHHNLRFEGWQPMNCETPDADNLHIRSFVINSQKRKRQKKRRRRKGHSRISGYGGGGNDGGE